MVTPVLKELDEFEFHHVIEASKGISLVFFTGPDCSSCHHLKHLFVSEAGLFCDSFDQFHAYEIKAEMSAALVNEFNVFHLPSMFIYLDGRFHCELHAQALPQETIKAIKTALNRPAQEEP